MSSDVSRRPAAVGAHLCYVTAASRVRRFLGLKCRKMGRRLSSDAIRDMVQETLYRVVKNGRVGDASMGFVLAIASNVLMETLRSGRRYVPLCDSDDDEHIAGPRSSPEAVEVGAQEAMAVSAVCEWLEAQSVSDRRFVRYRLLDARSQREVADLLGISRREVITCELRLRTAILRVLGRSGFAP